MAEKFPEKKNGWMVEWMVPLFCFCSKEFELKEFNVHFKGKLSLHCIALQLIIEIDSVTNSEWNINCYIEMENNFCERLQFHEGRNIQRISLQRTDKDMELIHCTMLLTSYRATVTPTCPIKEIKFDKDFLQLLETEQLPEVCLKVADKEIRAHKTILSYRSPVFKAMFEHRMKESSSNVVVIDDIEPDTLEQMVHFIYHDEVSDLKKFAAKLLPVSDKYDLKKLKFICERHLENNLSVENAAEILELADKHTSVELKKQAIDFMKHNSQALAQTIVSLRNHNPQLVDELLSEVIKPL